MASTTFVNYQTVIDAGWLNDVNSAVYSGTFQASTITPTNVTSTGAISGATVAGTTSVTTPIVKSGTSLTLQTNGSTTAVTIDTSQNVGIGLGNLAMNGGSFLTKTTAQSIAMFAGPTVTNDTARFECNGSTYSSNPNYAYMRGNPVVFTSITASEYGRFDSSGNLLVNTTSVSSSLASGHIQAPQGVAGGLSLTVSALSTRYAFNGAAVNGILILRDNLVGGTAIWLLDPNNGALVISTNIAATYTITFSGGNWGITQLTGATPKIWSYFMLASQ